MIVLVTLVAHRQHDEFRRADDLVQRDLPSGAERNDSFALSWLVPGRFVKVEGRDRQPEPHHHPDSADRSLGAFKVFGCFGVIEQEVKEAFQVSSGCNRQLDDKINRPSFSRLAASLDRSFYKTTSTSTKTLVWCYFSDVASARALKEVWTRRKNDCALHSCLDEVGQVFALSEYEGKLSAQHAQHAHKADLGYPGGCHRESSLRLGCARKIDCSLSDRRWYESILMCILRRLNSRLWFSSSYRVPGRTVGS